MVKPALKRPDCLLQNALCPYVCIKRKYMKKTTFLLPVLALASLTACEKDTPPLDLERFDVRWYDDDHTGTQTAGDALTFDIKVNTTSSDADYQYITEWDFSYFVNDTFGGALEGEEHAHTNTLLFDGDITIGNLLLPGPGALQPGDAVEFRLWCRDNHGTQLEQRHRFVVE